MKPMLLGSLERMPAVPVMTLMCLWCVVLERTSVERRLLLLSPWRESKGSPGWSLHFLLMSVSSREMSGFEKEWKYCKIGMLVLEYCWMPFYILTKYRQFWYNSLPLSLLSSALKVCLVVQQLLPMWRLYPWHLPSVVVEALGFWALAERETLAQSFSTSPAMLTTPVLWRKRCQSLWKTS